MSLLSPSRAISRLLDDDFFAPWAPMFPDPMPSMPSMSTELSNMARKISVGLVENEKDYSLKADLPGVKKEDLKVEIKDDRVLTISAERKESKQRTRKTEDGKEENVGSEHFSSSYYRSMMLPDDAEANPDKMSAELVDGVLTIEIPKTVKIPPVPKLVTIK
jgi:HSP20 family molecular chaperone IbpA